MDFHVDQHYSVVSLHTLLGSSATSQSNSLEQSYLETCNSFSDVPGTGCCPTMTKLT